MANATKDKVIALARRPNAKNTDGMLDNRLFNGGNNLNAILEDNGLWSLRYDHGLVPEPLKQKFTSFSMALRTAKYYFDSRNVDVKEIID